MSTKRPRKARSNASALETTLRAMAEMGRLEDIDAAQIQALRSMAGALDVRPSNAQLWKAYNEALERLTSDDDDGDELGELLAQFSAESRDTPPS